MTTTPILFLLIGSIMLSAAFVLLFSIMSARDGHEDEDGFHCDTHDEEDLEWHPKEMTDFSEPGAPFA